MAGTPEPKSQADVDPVFVRQIQQLVQAAGSIAKYLTTPGTILSWMVPANWSGNTRNIAGMSAPFDRSGINQAYEKVHSDAQKPGVMGDVVALKFQGDWLAMAERAFRIRQTSPVRDAVHQLVRHAAHGQSRGVFQYGSLGYVQDVLKAAKTPPEPNHLTTKS